MPTTVTEPVSRTADRCDRCGAAAQVRATLASGGVLHFCGHHARAHESRLREVAIELASAGDALGELAS